MFCLFCKWRGKEKITEEYKYGQRLSQARCSSGAERPLRVILCPHSDGQACGNPKSPTTGFEQCMAWVPSSGQLCALERAFQKAEQQFLLWKRMRTESVTTSQPYLMEPKMEPEWGLTDGTFIKRDWIFIRINRD